MTAELKGIHAKTFQDLDVIKDVLKLDEEKIAELEKENAELEQKLEQTEKDLADYQFNYPTIKELQKENAELLEKLKNQKADYETYYKSCYNAQKKTEKQLTKAKELLKQWLQTSKASGCDNINIVTDTEQFLNSKVEK